jgi:hypothetical protein
MKKITEPKNLDIRANAYQLCSTYGVAFEHAYKNVSKFHELVLLQIPRAKASIRCTCFVSPHLRHSQKGIELPHLPYSTPDVMEFTRR